MPRPTPPLRTITRRSRAVRVFAAQPSARVLAAACGAAAVARLRARRVGAGDLAVAAAVVASRGAHEWVIHRAILHARPRTVGGIRIDTGAGHRAHHDDPDVLERALLTRADACTFAGAVALWVGLLCAPARRVLGPRRTLTAIAAAEACLLAYEWRHFVDHTSVPLRSEHAQALRSHHRRHHHVDEGRFFGITATGGDRLHGQAARLLSAARR